MIEVSYKKHIVTGPEKGKSYVETQNLSNAAHALAFRRLLAEVTDLFPAKDPVSGEICYVTNINQKIIKTPE